MKATWALLIAAALCTGQAGAHEILLTPTIEGDTLKVAIDSTHFFVVPEELENVDNLTAALVTGEGETPVPITSGGALTLLAETPMPASSAWFVVHRLPLTFSNTADGLVEGGRDVNPTANSVQQYEKYTKALVNGEGGDDFVTAPLGQMLEVVPMSNPASLSVGDDLQVQVIFDGAPLGSASVEATYDGFSTEEMAFVSMVEADADGMATISITEPGHWFVRVAHDGASTTEGVDTHVLRAITSFEVD